MANTPDYTIDYNDKRFTDVDDDRNQAIADLDNVYGGMIGQTDQYFNNQINAIKDWGDTQAQIQQQQTDFTIDQINQQKDQAKKDYIKEQSGAYVDWQKQSNQYGANAEKMASAGLTNTGYSESSQVSMYNTYQNRVATAREVFNQAVLNYNNSIKEAQLQNSAALAEIAFQTLRQTLELSLQGFQYKNQLILDQANKKLEIDNIYWNRYQDVLQQINTENALAEDIRQYNETMKWNTTQAELNRQHDIKLKEIQHNYDVKMAEIDQKYKIAYLNASTEKEKEILEKQHQNDIAKLNKQLENEKALLAYQKSLQSAPLTGNSGSKVTSKTTMNAIRGTSQSSKGVANILASIQSPNVGNKSTSSIPTVNVQSKMSLGEGPMSDAKAADRVNKGTAKYDIVNNQVVLSPAVTLPTFKWKSSLPSITQPKKTTTKKTTKKGYAAKR